jgi:hypothetical protein
MKERKKILEDRKEAERPKVCRDSDGDGVRAGRDCPKGELLDCNDDDSGVAPGKPEVCDSLDNDCDGMVNEGIKSCVQTLFGGANWGNQAQHRLEHPRAILYDPAGFVLVTDAHHLWKVQLDGAVELLAGSHMSNFADGAGDAARFSYPTGMVKGSDGTVYVADCKNNCIRAVSPTGTVSSVAGFCSNLTKYTNQFSDGMGQSARFYCPTDLDFAPDGALIVVDKENARIRRVTLGGEVTTVAGVGPVEVEEGEGQIGFLDGPAHEARFNDPQSVLVDKKGLIYIAESFNCRIRVINTKKGEHGDVATLAGESDTLLGVGGHVDAAGAKAKFNFPHGMVWDAQGNMLVTDTGNSVIRKVTRSGRVSTVYGKSGEDKYVDGPIAEARFRAPMDIAVGPNGSIFVVDAASEFLKDDDPDRGRVRWIVP